MLRLQTDCKLAENSHLHSSVTSSIEDKCTALYMYMMAKKAHWLFARQNLPTYHNTLAHIVAT